MRLDKLRCRDEYSILASEAWLKVLEFHVGFIGSNTLPSYNIWPPEINFYLRGQSVFLIAESGKISFIYQHLGQFQPNLNLFSAQEQEKEQ